jgi:hypothetical protein
LVCGNQTGGPNLSFRNGQYCGGFIVRQTGRYRLTNHVNEDNFHRCYLAFHPLNGGNQTITFCWSHGCYTNCPIPEVYGGNSTGGGGAQNGGSIPWGGATGIRSLPYQREMGSQWRGGCLVLCACVRGGLYTVGECNVARAWALSQAFIGNDNYVNMTGHQLSQKFADRFGKRVNQNMSIQQGRGHFYITSGGNEYNSAGVGQLH